MLQTGCSTIRHSNQGITVSKRSKGQGSIIKRGEGSYQALLPPAVSRALYGKDRHSATFRDTEQAQAWINREAARAVLRTDGNEPRERREATLGALLAAWLDEKDGLLSETTLGNMRRDAKNHITAHSHGSLRVYRLAPSHIEMIVRDTPENWTRVRVSEILSVFCEWMFDNGWTDIDLYKRSGAAAYVTRFRDEAEPGDQLSNTWTPEQLTLFLEAERSPVYRDYWMLIAATGPRRGEGVGLTWSNTFPDERWCWLEKNVVMAEGRVVVRRRPKNRKRRKAYFGPSIEAMLGERRTEQDAYRSTQESWAGDWVFDRRRGWGNGYAPGVHLRPASVTWRFGALAESLDLPDISGPHGLRRTYATLLDHLRVRGAVRRALLGHGPANTTERYEKASEPELREVAEQVDAILFGGLSIPGAPPPTGIVVPEPAPVERRDNVIVVSTWGAPRKGAAAAI